MKKFKLFHANKAEKKVYIFFKIILNNTQN
jgi:hypothetical protein